MPHRCPYGNGVAKCNMTYDLIVVNFIANAIDRILMHRTLAKFACFIRFVATDCM